MAWPSGTIKTGQVDQGTDSMLQARAELKKLVDYVNTIIGARGQANGLAELDENGFVPDARVGGGVISTAGGAMTGALTLHADPKADLQAATKKYVDDNVGSLGVTNGRTAMWGLVKQGDTHTLANTFNISSLTDLAAGRTRVSFETSLSDTDYSIVLGGGQGTATNAVVYSFAAGEFVIQTRQLYGATGATGVAADGTHGFAVYSDEVITLPTVSVAPVTPPPVTTTNTDHIYILATTAPNAPSGGTTSENHLPAGYSRTEPSPTTTEHVYRFSRDRTYLDSTFTSATLWGSRTKVADATGVADTTSPVYVSATTNAAGTTVTLTFDENLDTSSIPAASAFTLSPTKTISNVQISGATVILTVSAAFADSDTITVSYTGPVSNPIQDASGNNSVDFSNEAVTNNVTSVSPPPVTQQTVNITTVGAGTWTVPAGVTSVQVELVGAGGGGGNDTGAGGGGGGGTTFATARAGGGGGGASGGLGTGTAGSGGSGGGGTGGTGTSSSTATSGTDGTGSGGGGGGSGYANTSGGDGGPSGGGGGGWSNASGGGSGPPGDGGTGARDGGLNYGGGGAGDTTVGGDGGTGVGTSAGGAGGASGAASSSALSSYGAGGAGTYASGTYGGGGGGGGGYTNTTLTVTPGASISYHVGGGGGGGQASGDNAEDGDDGAIRLTYGGGGSPPPVNPPPPPPPPAGLSTTITLPAGRYFLPNQNQKGWYNSLGQKNVPATFAAGNTAVTITTVTLTRSSGSYTLSIGVSGDFSTAMETSGTVTLTVGTDSAVVRALGEDTSALYEWTDNQADLQTLFDALPTTNGGTAGTLVLAVPSGSLGSAGEGNTIQTLMLDATRYLETDSSISWTYATNRPQLRAGFQPTATSERYLSALVLDTTGHVYVGFDTSAGVSDEGAYGLTPTFATTGSLTLVVGTHDITIPMKGAASQGGYLWVPSNNQDVITFVETVHALSGTTHDASVTFRNYTSVEPTRLGARNTHRSFTLTSDNAHALGIAVADGFAYVVDRNDDKVYVYELSSTGATYQSARDFPLTSANGGPTGIAVAEGFAYVPDRGDDKVYVYELSSTGATYQSARDFELESTNASPNGISIYDGRAYVADLDANKIFVYDLSTTGATYNSARSFDLEATNVSPGGIAVVDAYAHVVSGGTNRVYIYEVLTDGGRYLRSFAVGENEHNGLTVDAGLLYVVASSVREVAVYPVNYIPVPQAVQNLSEQSKTTSSITWAWDVPTSGEAPTSYEYRYAAGTEAPTTGTWTSTGRDTRVVIADLESNSSYTIQVRARNGTGTSPEESDVATTVRESNAPGTPSRPVLTDATADPLEVTTLRSPTGGVPDEYEFQLSDAPDYGESSMGVVETVVVTSPVVTYSGLVTGTTYYIRVRARNVAGNSPYSDSLVLTA